MSKDTLRDVWNGLPAQYTWAAVAVVCGALMYPSEAPAFGSYMFGLFVGYSLGYCVHRNLNTNEGT